MIRNKYVESEGNPNSKIYIVGEAPGETEETKNRPFVGAAGDMLNMIMDDVSLNREDCYMTNLSPYRPEGNKFFHLLGSRQLEEGIGSLKNKIEEYKPNVVACMGGWPTKFLCKPESAYKGLISKWRGSIISNIYGTKSVPCFHPSYILRNYPAYPVLAADLSRVLEESKFPELNHPVYNICTNPSRDDFNEWLPKLLAAPKIYTDIENVKNSIDIICIGFAYDEHNAIVVPWSDELYGQNFVRTILESSVQKCFHYGSHDITVLHANGYAVNAPDHDTIIQSHVLAPELERSLAYLTSIHTRQPFYKDEGKGEFVGDIKGWSKKRNKQELYIYNGKDCCCTAAVDIAQMKEINSDERYKDTYEFEMEEQKHAALVIGWTGMLIDIEYRKKVDHALMRNAIKYYRLTKILNNGYKFNPRSSKSTAKLLYEHLGLPRQYSRNKDTGKQEVTTDEDAIVKLIGICGNKIATLKSEAKKEEWEIKLYTCKNILIMRGFLKLRSSYTKLENNKGRSLVHESHRALSIYRVPGAETGRWSNAKFVDGTGYNMQTPPRDDLELEDIK